MPALKQSLPMLRHKFFDVVKLMFRKAAILAKGNRLKPELGNVAGRASRECAAARLRLS
jgi:hypothetical protein